MKPSREVSEGILGSALLVVAVLALVLLAAVLAGYPLLVRYDVSKRFANNVSIGYFSDSRSCSRDSRTFFPGDPGARGKALGP